MPDTDTTTQPAAPYTFPFPTPDLATLGDDELRALHQQVRDHAATFVGRPPSEQTDDTLTALQACRDLAVAVAEQITNRRTRAAQAAALEQDLAGTDAAIAVAVATDDCDEDDDMMGEPDTAAPMPMPATPPGTTAVTAAQPARPPRLRDVAANTTTAPAVPDQPAVRGSMTAAADVPGFSSGQVLATFGDAARALAARIDQYPAMTAGRATGTGGKRPITVYDPDDPGRVLTMRNFTRHSVIQMRRDLPADQRVDDTDGRRGYSVAEHVASERRLPGGSLRAAAALAVKQGRSLTAAVGWCAPSDTIYDLVELETSEGILDAPQLQTPRGGWQIPTNGGPDFATIYNALGTDGNTHLTEQQVIDESPTKVCTEISCPPFEDIRLGVDYYCLTGSLLQRRGYPEAVARFARAAAVALNHKINYGFIAAIVAGSGGALTIPSDPSGDDAASALLSAVDLAVMDMGYRHRMAYNATMEVVLPRWVLQPIRAAFSRRYGLGRLDLADAAIVEWFTLRHAVPRFVYDWQDAFSGLATGPGGATGLTHLPATVEFLVYPAGTWVKAVQDVVALDTVYDSTLLATNQYTAIFAEDGWAALKMGPLSRRYVVAVDPSGVVACCTPVGS